MQLLPPILGLVLSLSIAIAQDAPLPTLEELARNLPKRSTSELISALQTSAPKTLEDRLYFNKIFKELCDRASSSDLPTLSSIFASAPPDFHKSSLFVPLADAWLRLHAPEKLAHPPEFPDVSVDLPGIEKYPQDFQKAARAYARVVAPFRAWMKIEPTSQVSFLSHEDDYWKLAGDLFAADPKPLAGQLAAYWWGHWCGTGASRFEVPQSRALVIALIRENRWAEAVGASLSLSERTDPESVRFVPKIALSDPLEVVTGGLVSLDAKIDGSWTSSDRSSLLCLFLQLPGDSRVRTLIRLAELAPPEARTDYLTAIGRLVQKAPRKPGSKLWGSVSSLGTRLGSVSVEPVSPSAQVEALDFLSAQVSKPLALESAKTIAYILLQKQRPETIPALRQLLDHPSDTVAAKAAEALTAMDEKYSIPKKLGPVRYRITVAGRPYAERKITWEVHYGSTSTGTQVETDANGVASIPRDHFLPSDYGSVSKVVLNAGEMANSTDPWFGIALPPPPASDDIVPVDIQTSAQTVDFQFPEPLARLADQKMEVTLWGDLSSANYSHPAKFFVPFSKSLKLPALAPGKYHVEFHLPGTSHWSGELVAGQDTPTSIPLTRATDVKFRVAAPEGAYPAYFQPYLIQNGKELSVDWVFDKGASTLRSVSEGRYSLRFLSRREMEAKGQPVPGKTDFAAVEIPLEISPDSPAVIDLGEIRIPAKAN